MIQKKLLLLLTLSSSLLAQTVNGVPSQSVTAIPVANVTGAAPLASPALTGTPTAPTAAPGTNTTQIATMAALQTAVAGASSGAGIVVYSGPSLTLSGTLYFPIGGGGLTSSTETNVDIDSPAAATIQNFSVQMSAAPGVGNTVVYTWRKNGAGTVLTCTITGAVATACTDNTHAFSVAAADLMSIQAVTTGTIVGTPTVVMGTQFGIAAASGVLSLTGDGTLINNSASTGAATITLANAAAHKFWGNNTGSTAAPGYQSIGTGDLPTGIPNANLANPATTVNGQTCTLGSTCTVPAMVNITGSVTVSGCTVSGNVCTVGTPGTTVSFSSIPASYTNLKIVYNARGSTSAGGVGVDMQFNADGSAHYSWQQGAVTNSANSASGSGASATTFMQVCAIAAATGLASGAGECEITISNYANTNFFKFEHYDGTTGSDTAISSFYINRSYGGGFWNQTTAITAVSVFAATGNFVANSTFTIYGIP